MTDKKQPEELNEQDLDQAVGGATATAKTDGKTAESVVLSSESHEPSIRKR